MIVQSGAFRSIGSPVGVQPAIALGGTGSGAGSGSGGAAAGGMAGPAWLSASGNVVNKWVPIANTSLYTHIHSNAAYTALLAATGVSAASVLAYSGAAFKQSTAEWLLGAYGGGANAWPGTDIVGLSLTADAPAWALYVAPRPYAEIWPRNSETVQNALSVNVGASTLTDSSVNGFQNGESCTFGGGTAPAPLVNGTTYYVVNASGYQPVTFQLSATLNGSPITLTNAGSSPTAVWANRPHTDTKSGYPEPCHTYAQENYVEQTSQLVLNGRANAWETDTGVYGKVRTWTYGAADWDAAGIYPTTSQDYDNAWQCIDNTTGTIYYCKYGGNWYARNPTTGVETYKGNCGNGAAAGYATFDPTRGTIIKWDTTVHWQELTPSTGASRNFTLGGPDAGSFIASYSLGFCCDEATGTYYLYLDAGVLYALTWSGGNLSMAAVASTGTAPTSGWGAVNGGIWTRLRYSTALHGVVLLANAANNVFFMRTN